MSLEELKGVDYLSSPYSFVGFLQELNQMLEEKTKEKEEASLKEAA